MKPVPGVAAVEYVPSPRHPLPPENIIIWGVTPQKISCRSSGREKKVPTLPPVHHFLMAHFRTQFNTASYRLLKFPFVHSLCSRETDVPSHRNHAFLDLLVEKILMAVGRKTNLRFTFHWQIKYARPLASSVLKIPFRRLGD